MSNKYKDLVDNFHFQHRHKFPKKCYDQCFKFEDGVSIHYYNHKKKEMDVTRKGKLSYRFLKRTDPETFNYHTITTTVDIIPLYIAHGDREYSRIYMSTIDDSMMGILTTPLDDHSIYKLIEFYKGKRVIESCEDEYMLLSEYMGWCSLGEYYDKVDYKKIKGKLVYQNNLNDPIIKDLDFN